MSRPQPQADHWMQFLGTPWSTLMFYTCCSLCQIAVALPSRGQVMPVMTGLRLRSPGQRIRARESLRVNKAADRSPSRLPAGLEGGAPGNRNNQPICFDHNLPHGCKLPVTKGRCRKGMHICCMKNCLQSSHTFQTCPNKRSN